MSVDVHVSAVLRNQSGAKGNYEVEGRSIREVVEAIDNEHPGFSQGILQPDGSVQQGVLISINGEILSSHSAGEKSVQSGDKVHFLSAFAGG